jgi:membrane protein YdbS with pleckstrin-like domain
MDKKFILGEKMDTETTKRFKPSFLLAPFSNLFSTKVLVVSPDSIVYLEGLFDKKERSIPTSKITDVTLSQSLMGRIFGYGTLNLQTSGSGEAEVTFKSLGGARTARDLMLKYISKAD